MRLNIIRSSVLSLVIAGSFMACTETPQEKVDSAKEKANDARENVVDAKKELQDAKIDSVTEYVKFKAMMEMKLKQNDAEIMALQAKMKTAKKEVSARYEKELADLQDKNARLRTRMNEYKETTSDKWDDFKTSFNKDMEALGKSISSLGEKSQKK